MKENRSFEVKERVTNTFLKTVSAYANFGDGIIRFGITDDGKFVVNIPGWRSHPIR